MELVVVLFDLSIKIIKPIESLKILILSLKIC